MASFVTDIKNALGFGSEPEATTYDGILISRDTTINGLFLDASISESHALEVEYPSHPIEAGADINDHRIIKPEKFTINGVIADFTLSQAQTSYKEGDGLTRSQAAWNTLKNLIYYEDPFDVLSILTEYKNMQGITLTCTQNKDSATSIDFVMVLQEIRITETDVITLPDSAFPAGPVREQASANASLGTKQPKALSVSLAQAAKNSLEKTAAEVQ